MDENEILFKWNYLKEGFCGGNWLEWKFYCDNKYYFGSMKIYGQPSKWGIKNGKISKFEARLESDTPHLNVIIANYDRGWDIKPDEKHNAIINKIIDIIEENAPDMLSKKPVGEKIYKKSDLM